jgi:hypothetical protein
MVLSENTLSDDYIRLSDNIMLSADNMSSDSIVILSDLLSDNIFLLADNVILSDSMLSYFFFFTHSEYSCVPIFKNVMPERASDPVMLQLTSVPPYSRYTTVFLTQYAGHTSYAKTNVINLSLDIKCAGVNAEANSAYSRLG